jgi:hypothetical protein
VGPPVCTGPTTRAARKVLRRHGDPNPAIREMASDAFGDVYTTDFPTSAAVKPRQIRGAGRLLFVAGEADERVAVGALSPSVLLQIYNSLFSTVAPR